MRHARGHHRHELRAGHARQERPNRERRLGLSHEDRRRDVEAFRAARTHDLVHRDRKRLHHDLHDAEVVHDREQRGDEDDGRHDLEREYDAEARVLFPDLTEHKLRAGVGKTQDLCYGRAEPAEDLLADGNPKHKDREKQLQPDPPGDDTPADRTPVPRERDAHAADQDEAEDSREPGAEGARLGAHRRRRHLSLGGVLRGRLYRRAAQRVEHEARQREHDQRAPKRDQERKENASRGHQRAPNSLWTRDTSATFSYSGRNALSQAFNTTRCSSSDERPSTACARKYSSVKVMPSVNGPSVFSVTTTPCWR